MLNIDDVVLEHYPPKAFNENGKLIGATMAFCIGAPEDIAYKVSDLLYQQWAWVQSRELDETLGESSNLKKYLIIPFDGNKLLKEDRVKLMAKHTDFRMYYKGLSLNETESVDTIFNLDKEECTTLFNQARIKCICHLSSCVYICLQSSYLRLPFNSIHH